MASHPQINTVIEDKIICVRCEQWKKPESFSLSPRMKRGRHSWCRECMGLYNKVKNENLTDEQRESRRVHRRTYQAETARRWHAKNPEKQGQYFRKYFYDLSKDQYDKMVSEQKGLCLICHLPPSSGSGGDHLHVDHDHTCCPGGYPTCGKCLRDLVCWPCNLIMGLAQDDPARLRALADYLERWQRLKDTATQ